MNMFKSNGGFTLVELIVVIAILAILAGAAIPAYSGYIARANDSTVTAELEAVETAAFAAAALIGETPVQISITSTGDISVFVEDQGDYDLNGKKDEDSKMDALEIDEFYEGTVDLSKHSKYATYGCCWLAEDPDDEGPWTAGWNDNIYSGK